MRHKTYTITPAREPYFGAFEFISDDYDAEMEDGEFIGNGLCGFGDTIENCIEQIEEMEKET